MKTRAYVVVTNCNIVMSSALFLPGWRLGVRRQSDRAVMSDRSGNVDHQKR